MRGNLIGSKDNQQGLGLIDYAEQTNSHHRWHIQLTVLAVQLDKDLPNRDKQYHSDMLHGVHTLFVDHCDDALTDSILNSLDQKSTQADIAHPPDQNLDHLLVMQNDLASDIR